MQDDIRVRYEGRMRHLVSVSQIKSFAPSKKGCPRKWAFEKLFGFPKQESEALIFGTELHWAIEALLRGRAFDRWEGTKVGALAIAMSRHVAVKSEWECEPTYFLEVPEIDTAIYVKPDLLRVGFLALKDWKSTSARSKRSPWVLHDSKWNIDGDTLQNDIQANVYAHGLMQRFGAFSIDAEWVYGSKGFQLGEAPSTWSIKATFEREPTRQWCEQYVWPTIEVMNAIREAKNAKGLDTPLLVPHHAFSCEHTGKFCDFLGYCGFRKSPVSLERLHLPVIPA